MGRRFFTRHCIMVAQEDPLARPPACLVPKMLMYATRIAIHRNKDVEDCCIMIVFQYYSPCSPYIIVSKDHMYCLYNKLEKGDVRIHKSCTQSGE